MKKTLIISFILLLGSVIKVHGAEPLEKKSMFYVKAGISLNKIYYYKNYNKVNNRIKYQIGEAIDIGYSMYLKRNLYWAPEIGIVTRGCAYDIYNSFFNFSYKSHRIYHGVKASPINWGYRIPLPHHLAIDPHIGGYFCYYFMGKMESYDYKNYSYMKMERRYNAGFDVGVSFWYKRFCFDFTYNTGFVSYNRQPIKPADMSEVEFTDILEGSPKSLKWEVKSSNRNYNYNLQFKFGIAF